MLQHLQYHQKRERERSKAGETINVGRRNTYITIRRERERSKAGETISVGCRNTYNTIRRERERSKAGETISVGRRNTYNIIRRMRERVYGFLLNPSKILKDTILLSTWLMNLNDYNSYCRLLVTISVHEN